ncbi:M48 family metallopeptidase [Bradymonas sediminis]|nr:M48 family metallopeptidase [Bradymonas sediminis]
MSKTLVTRLQLVILSLAMLGFASGCATGVGGKATNTAANVLLPAAEEEKLGDQMRGQVRAEFTILDNPEIQGYIRELGAKIVRASGNQPRGISYTFDVIDGNEINAFTTPGGDIYIYTGLIKAAENEAELIGVIAHEVAHVTNRHIAEKLVASYGLQTVLDMALGQNAGTLTQLGATLGAQGYLLKYGRDQESEADRDGLNYMVRAGYDPNGFVTFFKKLEARGGGGIEMLSSHPLPKSRIDQARAIIRKMGNTPDNLGTARLQEMKKKL